MKSVRSVDRATDILLAFIETPVLGIGELQSRLELPRPTLYRMLTALEHRGLVSWFGEPRRYRLGQKVLELSRSWQRSFNLVEISQPSLQQLWEVYNETVMLFVPSSANSRMLLYEIRSTRPLSYSRPIGYVAPLTIGAAGKVILAFRSDTEIRAVGTESSEDVFKKLQSDLHRIRKSHYCIVSNEVEVGALSIAAPIFGHEAEVLGAVAMIGPEGRMQGVVRTRLLPALLEATQTISRKAGFLLRS